MFKRIVLIAIWFSGCTPPAPQPFKPPPVKTTELQPKPSPLAEGLLTEYDIWEFLKEQPTETEVVEMLGLPDSVWVSDEEPYYVLYYYIPHLQDYNSIVLDQKQRRVTEYEWDE